MAVLVIEQNIGVATTISENVAIMVNGRVNRIIDSRAACRRPRAAAAPARRRPSTPSSNPTSKPAGGEAGPSRAAAVHRSTARSGSIISNPTPPTRWSQPVPIARIEAAARTLSAGVTRLDEIARQGASRRAAQTSGPPVVLVVGTLDTKGAELRFIRDIIAGSGLRTRLVDVSTSGKPRDLRRLRPGNRAQPRPRRLGRVRRRSRRLGDRHGRSVRELDAPPGQVAGIISAGGSAAPRWSRPACAPCPSACRK